MIISTLERPDTGICSFCLGPPTCFGSGNDLPRWLASQKNLLLSADLVTLSACETALGKVSTGDDVVGFTRGFLYAGTRSLVSSLWQVDDETTRFDG